MSESELTELKNFHNKNPVQRIWGLNGLVQETIINAS